MAVAPSAAGKKTALCISLLQKIDSNTKGCQALILASDQGAARQIREAMDEIGHFMQISSLDMVSSDVHADTSAFHDSQQIVIGEPSEVYDMIRSNMITSDSIRLLALDEADKLSSSNMYEQIYGIFQLLPESTQAIFLSETTPQHMLDLAARIMPDYVHVMVKTSDDPLDGLHQSYSVAETEDAKLGILSELHESSALAKGVIFCNTRKTVEWLEQKLVARGWDVSAMHYDMPATDRGEMMADFRSSDSRVLIATQMLARGIDKEHMPLIVNFDLPADPKKYVERTGVVGPGSDRERAVINLVTAEEAARIQEIEKIYNAEIKQRY